MVKWYTELISFAIDHKLPTSFQYYGIEPDENYLGIKIDGILFGPFAWEMFEDEIDFEDVHRAKVLVKRTKLNEFMERR